MPSNANTLQTAADVVSAAPAQSDTRVAFIISGTYASAVVTIEGTLDPVGAATQTWGNLSAVNRGTGNLDTGNLTPADNSTVIWDCQCGNMKQVRLRLVSITSGSILAEVASGFFPTSLPVLSQNLPQANILASQTATNATRNSGDLNNIAGLGLLLRCRVSAMAGTPTFTPSIDWKTPSGNYSTIWTAAAAINTNTNTLYSIYPGIGAVNGSFTEIAGVHIPRTLRVNLTYAGTPASDKATTFVEGEILT